MQQPGIYRFEGHAPSLSGAFVLPGATVLGRVSLGEGSSVWYGSVLRGDVGSITVGARTNIQDLSVVHVTTDKFDVHIGDDVTIGHRVIVHGCRIGHRALIGMGAVLLDGCEIGDETLIGAGSLVAQGAKIPSGVLALGTPAKVLRPLSASEKADIARSALHYVELAERHARSRAPV